MVSVGNRNRICPLKIYLELTALHIISFFKLQLSCAVASGFRNSGISLGNKGKIIVVIISIQVVKLL